MAGLMCASGLDLAAYDSDVAASVAFSKTCAIHACRTLEELVSSVCNPRRLWIMPGAAACFERLEPLLEADDIVVDCAVIHYKNTVRRSTELAERHITLIDAGVCGNGVHHALMLGGEAQALDMLKPCLEAISPQRWLHCGPSGSGHFLEQVHKHIQHSVSQTVNQSLAVIRNIGSLSFNLDAMARIWQMAVADQTAIQGLVVDFLNETGVLSRIRSGNAQELAGLQQQMTPALNLALALHYADLGSRLFQQQISAALGTAARPKSI